MGVSPLLTTAASGSTSDLDPPTNHVRPSRSGRLRPRSLQPNSAEKMALDCSRAYVVRASAARVQATVVGCRFLAVLPPLSPFLGGAAVVTAWQANRRGTAGLAGCGVRRHPVQMFFS